jgi:thioredoxin 1
MASDLIKHISDAGIMAFHFDGCRRPAAKYRQPRQANVLVDYWAEWCGPCKMIAPILDEVSTGYKDKLQIAKMNVDENRDIPAKFGIRGIPTLMLFKDGQLAATKVGAMSKAQLTPSSTSNWPDAPNRSRHGAAPRLPMLSFFLHNRPVRQPPARAGSSSGSGSQGDPRVPRSDLPPRPLKELPKGVTPCT